MTPERIAELRRLAEAATKGPWEAKEPAFMPGVKARVFGPGYAPKHDGKECLPLADAAFIAAARSAVPELLDEVERLRARCERLEKVREAAEALCEQVEYVKYYTADSTALSAIRSALAAALEGE